MKMKTLILSCALMLGASLAVAQPGAPAGKDYGHVRVQAAAAKGAVDSPVGVQIDYAGLPASGASVAYATEGGLTLQSPASKQLTADSRGAAQDTVVVRAASDGAYFLNVFVSANGATQAVSIPVTVGNATLKPRAAKAVSTPAGQSVIEMPAQQTVH